VGEDGKGDDRTRKMGKMRRMRKMRIWEDGKMEVEA
jgi:hypothetical protein